MTKVQLRIQLALARRQHSYRQRKLDIAHQRNDKTEIKHWHQRLAEAGKRIIQLENALARLKPHQVSARTIAVAKARSYVGVTENPLGSNGGGIIDAWERAMGVLHVAWCGIFNATMLRAAGVVNVPNAIMSVAATENMARAHQACFRGFTTNTRAALPGDIVLLGRYGQHQGLVEHVHDDGSLDTLEGNCNQGVRAMRRQTWQIRGIAQVNFPG